MKLTDEQKDEIIQLYNDNWTLSSLARRFNTSRQNVFLIVNPEKRRESITKASTMKSLKLRKEKLAAGDISQYQLDAWLKSKGLLSRISDSEQTILL
jgi:predicted DNA-binding protein YlxM (UPF0122 family)